MGSEIDPRRIQQARAQVREARTREERVRALQTLVMLAPDDARAQFRLAHELVRDERHEARALEHFRRAAAADPTLAEAKLGIGIIHHRRREYDLAESMYLAALAAKPGLPKAQLNLAAIAQERGDSTRAADLFAEAIRAAPRHPGAREGRAKALWALGRRDEAVAEWDHALAIDPQHPGALRGLAEALAEAGDPRAGEFYRRAIAADPRSVRLRASMARWLAAGGQVGEAEAVLREGLSTTPQSKRLWSAFVDLLRQQGRPDDAVAAIRSRLAEGGDVDLRLRLARLLCELGRFDAAARDLRPVLLARPGDAEVRRLMAAAQACAGRHDEAVAAAHAALRLSPGCSWPRLLLMSFPSRPQRAVDELVLSESLVLPTVRAYGFSMQGILELALGNAPAAAQLLQQAVQVAPEAALPRVGRGLVYLAEGKPEPAYAELRTAAILEPRDHNVQHLAGEGAFHTRRYEEAARAFDTALLVGEAEPFLRAYTFFCRARALRRLGRAHDAVQCYVEAERLDPEYAPAYYACGVALQELGQTSEALAQYEQCVARAPGHSRGWMGVATCLERLGRVPEAVDAYRSAIRADADYAPPRYNLAVLLERTGAPEEVAALLRGYLRASPNAPNAADASRRLALAELRASGVASKPSIGTEDEETPFLDTSDGGGILTPAQR